MKKKKEFEEEYKKGKELILKETDIKLKIVINTEKIEKKFYEIINKVKSNIINETNKIKEEIKDSINDYNIFILDLYNDIINFIDECMKSDIINYADNPLYALEETVICILDIVSEKYYIGDYNKNYFIGKLISYFEKKINNCQKFCEYLIEKGLLSNIKKIRKYTKDKLNTIQSFYDSILNMTKKYLNLLLQNAKEYLSTTSKCLDNTFDYFLEYIEKIYNNCCLYELYFINKLKSINSFITDITIKIKEKKNEEINKLSNILEQNIEKEYNKLMQFKDEVKNKINNTFDTFENKVMNKVDNKICQTASDFEKKLINIAQNLDDKAEQYLQMIYPNDIDSKLFSLLKKKKDNLLTKFESDKLNEGINRLFNSQLINTTKKIMDKIDLDKANSIIDDINRISNSLRINSKYEFKNNIKSKIKEKILYLYSSKIEKELREFINNLVNKLINKI